MAENLINVSIIIPTHNEEKNIGNTLQSILNQDKNVRVDNNIIHLDTEIIMIDSGSTDNTVAVALSYKQKFKKFNAYMTHHFHHSITRNFGAKKASGEILIFLNADAKPANKYWLKNLVLPLLKGYAASFSRQIPPSNLLSVDSLLVVAGFPDASYSIDKSNYVEYFSKFGVLLSSVSCGIDRQIFFSIGGFNKYVPINEDQELALRLIKSGHKIFYAANSCVVHAHSDHPIKTPIRYYRYGVGWKIIAQLHRDFKQKYSMEIPKSIIQQIFTKELDGSRRIVISLGRIKTFIYTTIALISAGVGRYL